MQEFLDFAAMYWPNILNGLSIAFGYFLILLYKYSTRNLNGHLKTTFAENITSVLENDSKFQKEMERRYKEAEEKYREAVKICEEYQHKVIHLEETLRDLLDGGE